MPSSNPYIVWHTKLLTIIISEFIDTQCIWVTKRARNWIQRCQISRNSEESEFYFGFEPMDVHKLHVSHKLWELVRMLFESVKNPLMQAYSLLSISLCHLNNQFSE